MAIIPLNPQLQKNSPFYQDFGKFILIKRNKENENWFEKYAIKQKFYIARIDSIRKIKDRTHHETTIIGFVIGNLFKVYKYIGEITEKYYSENPLEKKNPRKFFPFLEKERSKIIFFLEEGQLRAEEFWEK